MSKYIIGLFGITLDAKESAMVDGFAKGFATFARLASKKGVEFCKVVDAIAGNLISEKTGEKYDPTKVKAEVASVVIKAAVSASDPADRKAVYNALSNMKYQYYSPKGIAKRAAKKAGKVKAKAKVKGSGKVAARAVLADALQMAQDAGLTMSEIKAVINAALAL